MSLTERSDGDKNLETHSERSLDDLSERLKKLKVPPEEVGSIVEMIAYQYSGPVPPPQIVRGWNDVLPGAADRLLQMAEREQIAQIEIAKDTQRRNDRFRIIYAFLGAALIAGTLACAAFALAKGYPWIAAGSFGVAFFGVVMSFLKISGAMSQSAPAATSSQETQPSAPKAGKPAKSAKRNAK